MPAQDFTGKSRFLVDHHEGPHRLLVAVACRIGDLRITSQGLLDTASEWCVLPPDLAHRLDLDLEPDLNMPVLWTRFGSIRGRLERVTVWFPSEEGEPLEVNATCFVSAEWPGPLVIGWKGCLERMRFALDPGDDSFYFGEP
jgi:hypothetical protein